MTINRERLLSRIQKMNEIGALPGGGNCRLALSDEDKAARDLLAVWMKEEGLEIEVDQMGNMYGMRPGTDAVPSLALGSHLDTVTTGGRYDGTYGVLAALEVVSVLNDEGRTTKKPLVVVNFTNEEGARFAPDMMGSLVVSKPELLAQVWTAEDLGTGNTTVKDELKRIGYLGATACGSVPIDQYLELHIEQGPILEREGFAIGVVEKVQGIYWTEYVLKGQAAHAGTTPLNLRKDPGLLAAQFNVYLRSMAEETPGQLGTVGLQEFHPNVINVVPDHVRLVTDLRNPDEASLRRSQEKVDTWLTREGERNGIDIRRTEKVRLAPVGFSQEMVSHVEGAVKRLGLKHRRMVSGAGHDAQMMAAVAKAAMIFVPSVNGLSHNEKEYTSPEDLVNGATVLLETVVTLAGR